MPRQFPIAPASLWAIISVWASVFVSCVGNAQGTVYFRNRIEGQVGAVDAPFYNDQGVRLQGSNFVAQLYAWNAGGGFVAVGTPVPFATNGYFFGEAVIIPFVYGCNPASVQVRAWAVQGGTTFEEAAAGGAWTGVSGVLCVTQTGDPARPETGCEGRLIGLQYPGKPLVVREPQSDAVLVAEEAMLSVIASSGVLMAFQWYQQPSDRPDGLIPGATNATYTTPPLTNNTTFWVAVSNSAGSVTSDKAAVTVAPGAPRLSLQQGADLPLLTLDGSVGLTYRIEYNMNLSTTGWTRLVDLSLHSSPFSFIDPGATDSAMRFYRAVVP